MSYDSNGNLRGQFWEESTATTIIPTAPKENIVVNDLTVNGNFLGPGSTTNWQEGADVQELILIPPKKKIKIDSISTDGAGFFGTTVGGPEVQTNSILKYQLTAGQMNIIEVKPSFTGTGTRMFMLFGGQENVTFSENTYSGVIFQCTNGDNDFFSQTAQIWADNAGLNFAFKRGLTNDGQVLLDSDKKILLGEFTCEIFNKLVVSGGDEAAKLQVKKDNGDIYFQVNTLNDLVSSRSLFPQITTSVLGDNTLPWLAAHIGTVTVADVYVNFLRPNQLAAVYCTGDFHPSGVTGTQNCGSDALRWGTVFSVDGDFSGELTALTVLADNIEAKSGTGFNIKGAVNMLNSLGADFGNNEEMIHFNMGSTRDWGLWAHFNGSFPGDLSWQSSSTGKNFEVATTVNSNEPAIRIRTTSGIDISGEQHVNARNVYPFVNGEGNLGLDTLRWAEVHANLVYGNGVLLTSDKRKKKNLADSTLGLALISKLKPKFYHWKNEAHNRSGKKTLGLVAQDIEESLLEMNSDIDLVVHDVIEAKVVKEAEQEIVIPARDDYSVNYMALIPVLITAVQEQQTMITSLLTRLESLEKKSKAV